LTKRAGVHPRLQARCSGSLVIRPPRSKQQGKEDWRESTAAEASRSPLLLPYVLEFGDRAKDAQAIAKLEGDRQFFCRSATIMILLASPACARKK